MQPDIASYHHALAPAHRALCDALAAAIGAHLSKAEGKLWHGHPVWFLDGNPIVGYSLQKPGVRLMFWSGADFDEPLLAVRGKKFKDASIFFNQLSELDPVALERWLALAARIQWDYKNIVRRKGRLARIETADRPSPIEQEPPCPAT
ncbi:DUF1801 domain-containing protein [Inhella sp.]|uniref:DUF1801 domain-containing protein n=1 Tax=Inhella sp. TaxID=1921806 RepID=UPI0035AFF18B